MRNLRLPEFIIAGAARAGTTWLYELLDRHPQVWMARPRTPEPKFFLVDETYARGLAFYAATRFGEVPPGRVAGEKSTNYLESSAAASRIAQDLPRVKLLFILREPVARAYSNYLWSRMNGLEHEDFETALRLEDERERDVAPEWRYARPHAYFSRGLYAQMLRPYFARFPREQILCVRFEDIQSRRDELVAEIHEFLGVSVRPADAASLGIVNPSAQPDGPLRPDIRRALAARYAEPNRELLRLLNSDFRGWDDG